MTVKLNIDWSKYGRTGELLYIFNMNCITANKIQDEKIIEDRLISFVTLVGQDKLKKLGVTIMNSSSFNKLSHEQKINYLLDTCRILLNFYIKVLIQKTNFTRDVLIQSMDIFVNKVPIGGKEKRKYAIEDIEKIVDSVLEYDKISNKIKKIFKDNIDFIVNNKNSRPYNPYIEINIDLFTEYVYKKYVNIKVKKQEQADIDEKLHMLYEQTKKEYEDSKKIQISDRGFECITVYKKYNISILYLQYSAL
jgi:hypothetical protein